MEAAADREKGEHASQRPDDAEPGQGRNPVRSRNEGIAGMDFFWHGFGQASSASHHVGEARP